jgi:broad specificity phosphatase PhoE
MNGEAGERPRTLILVRHAKSRVERARPPDEWSLSPAGERGAAVIAPMLERHRPGRLIASPEPKARQTAEILGRCLDLDVEIANGLREHDRTGVPFFETQEEFERRVTELFERPTERVLGRESAVEACRRFSATVQGALDSRPEACLAFVTHGTVMSLFLGSLATLEPLGMWRRLCMPAYAVLEWPSGRIIELVSEPAPPPTDG